MNYTESLIAKRYEFGFRDSWNQLTPQLFTDFKLYNEKEPKDKREANIILQKQLKYCWDLYFDLNGNTDPEYQQYSKFIRSTIDKINEELKKL